MKILRVLPLFLLLTAPLLAASITGTWKGDVKIPAGVVVPFTARLKQQGDKVTGALSVGPAKDIPIFNGETVGDTITFSAIHKVAVVSATETKKFAISPSSSTTPPRFPETACTLRFFTTTDKALRTKLTPFARSDRSN